MIAPTIVLEIRGQADAQWLAWHLIEQSCWFQIMPLPDDEWQLSIKNEPGLLSAVRAILDQYRACKRPIIELQITAGINALRIRMIFNQPEAKGEVVFETGVYGLHILAPEVHPALPVAQLDLFHQSTAALECTTIHDKPKINLLLHAPAEREDPIASLAYYPKTRLTLDWELKQKPITTVGEVVFELEP